MNSLTVKARDVKDIIAKQFGDIILGDGFTYHKTANEFRIDQNDCRNIFNIEQVAWSNSFSLHPKLYISQKQITSTIAKILGKQRHDYTIGDEIGKIYGSPDGRSDTKTDMSIWIREDRDIDAVIESLTWYYRDIAKPYFNRYKTLKAFDDIINNPPFDHCPPHVGGMFFERCIKGLIVARLVDNPDYNKLVEIYDSQIKTTMNDEFIEAYQKVKEYLNYHQIK